MSSGSCIQSQMMTCASVLFWASVVNDIMILAPDGNVNKKIIEYIKCRSCTSTVYLGSDKANILRMVLLQCVMLSLIHYYFV